MPKNLFKRFLPNSDRFKKDRHLNRAMGDWLHKPQLWVLNRYSISRAVFIGLFCSFLPIPGQMIVVAFACFFFSANMPLAMSLVWISNPITMLPMMYAAYLVGCYILDRDVIHFDHDLGFTAITSNIEQFIEPLLLGCFISGLITALFGYWIIQLAWRWSVARTWRMRQQKRKLGH